VAGWVVLPVSPLLVHHGGHDGDYDADHGGDDGDDDDGYEGVSGGDAS
jgi:hypothetical protein